MREALSVVRATQWSLLGTYDGVNEALTSRVGDRDGDVALEDVCPLYVQTT